MSDIQVILEKVLPARIAEQYTEDFRACARLMLRGLLAESDVARIRATIAERIKDEAFVMGVADRKAAGE